MRREKASMMIEILKNARERILLTHLMYKSNINCTKLKEFLGILKERGFIDFVYDSAIPKKRCVNHLKLKGENTIKAHYKTTQKGLKIIVNHDRLLFDLGIDI